MARHRRHYRGLVKFPGLGGLSIPKSVNPVDVVVGVALGFAGSGAIKAGAAKLAAGGTQVPSFVVSAGPVVGGAATAALLYVLEKKKNPGRAAGHAVGALLGGLAVSGWEMLQSSGVLGSSIAAGQQAANIATNAAVQGYGALRTLPGGMGGPIFDNPRAANTRMLGFNGPIFDNPRMNMARLANLQGMGDENEDGMFPAP